MRVFLKFLIWGPLGRIQLGAPNFSMTYLPLLVQIAGGFVSHLAYINHRATLGFGFRGSLFGSGMPHETKNRIGLIIKRLQPRPIL